MSVLRTVAGICYAAHALILIVIGLRYVRSKEFQPYHAVALGRDWNSLDPALQVLLLTFTRGIGALLIAITAHGTPVNALSMQECSAKYKAPRTRARLVA